MPQEEILNIKQFKCLKNDEDSKQIPFDYFYRMSNFNYPDDGILGINKILMPKQIRRIGTHSIDGLFEFRYLDSNNSLVTENIGVTYGSIYKNALDASPTTLKTGLTAGLVSFAAYKDKLFIANGKNYVNVYWGSLGVVSEMGAPAAVASAAGGNPNGTYYYAMTYSISGAEDVLGSVSNTITVSNKQIVLHLPIGYQGTTARKIYRIANGGTTLKLVATINDNTTLTYTDNIADGDLGSAIPAVNNELPKPYQLAIANQSLYGAVIDNLPTQVHKTEANIEVWNSSNFIDVANYGNDNTPVAGIGVDFSKIIVGTGKQIYFVEPSDTIVNSSTVKPTRANCGMKSGYTPRSVPAHGDFPCCSCWGLHRFLSTRW